MQPLTINLFCDPPEFLDKPCFVVTGLTKAVTYQYMLSLYFAGSFVDHDHTSQLAICAYTVSNMTLLSPQEISIQGIL